MVRLTAIYLVQGDVWGKTSDMAAMLHTPRVRRLFPKVSSSNVTVTCSIFVMRLVGWIQAPCKG